MFIDTHDLRRIEASFDMAEHRAADYSQIHLRSYTSHLLRARSQGPPLVQES